MLSKRYLPISLLSPFKLQEILNKVKKALHVTSPDYEIIIKRLYLYCDMKLVTFGDISISCFHWVKYWKKTYFVSSWNCASTIVDLNGKGNLYIKLQVEKPNILLNEETYISFRGQELRNCKNIGYEFYYEELFVVKHEFKYRCETAVYFKTLK